MNRRRHLLQIDPAAAVAPDADLCWSRKAMIRPAEDLAPDRAGQAEWPELGTPSSVREGWRRGQERQREVTQRRLRPAAFRLELGFALP
ncbi:hypothetical protein [Streptomyces sp. NPDC001537]